MLFSSIAVPKPWTLQDVIWVILCHFPLYLGAALLELQLFHYNSANGKMGEGERRVRQTNDRKEPPFPAREKKSSWSHSGCWWKALLSEGQKTPVLIWFSGTVLARKSKQLSHGYTSGRHQYGQLGNTPSVDVSPSQVCLLCSADTGGMKTRRGW